MARWFVDRNPQRGIPSVSLRRLLPDARFLGCEDLVVSGCSADSVRIDPGQVFVAAGEGAHRELTRALDRGAAAVVVERDSPEAGRPQVVVPDARRALGRLCQALAGEPSERLDLFAVVGRSGQSACSRFARSIFEAAGRRFGRISAEGWSDGVTESPAGPTEPGAEAIARILSAMVDRRCRGGIIAASDAAWGSGRFEGVALGGALIADGGIAPARNAEDLGSIRKSRARAFRRIAPGGVAAVRIGDREAELMGAVNLSARQVGFAIGRRPGADVWGELLAVEPSGTRFRLLGFDREAIVTIRPVGTRRVVHALGAAALAWAEGIGVDEVASGLEAVDRLAGRLESVDQIPGVEVRLDAARSADALHEALASLREITPGPIRCVVGVSPTTDPDFARIAEQSADAVVLTLADPGLPDGDAILDAALARCLRPGRILVDPDRTRAVSTALSLALPGEGVLLAGGPPYVDRLADRPSPRDDRSLAIQWTRTRTQNRKSA